MNPKVEKLPGLRKPTSAEQEWIARNWEDELRQGYSANGGKLMRYIGIFLICTSVVNLVRGSSGGVVGMIMLLLLAAVCLGASSIGKKSSRDHGARIKAVECGDYLVAEAVATKVDTSYRGNRPIALVNAVLPDGRKLNSIYRIPYICAKPLLNQEINDLPILLISFSCDPDILAIPKK